MKVLQFLVLVNCSVIFAFSQNLDRKFTITGTVYDSNKAIVVGTKITAKDLNGKIFKTVSGENGKYKLDLPAKSYIVEFTQTGFKLHRVINFEVNADTKNILDVTLEVGRCEDCNGAIYGNRSDDFAKLSGNVYDANGSLIVGARVKAVSNDGKKLETVTNDEGIYILNLLFNPYTSNSDFKMATYEIIFDAQGFETKIIKNFSFAPSSKGKMQFDIALDSENPEPCGYGGNGCLPESQIIEEPRSKVSDRISKRPLKKLTKAENKNKRKIN